MRARSNVTRRGLLFRAALGGILLLGAVEAAVRASGAIDFPIYILDDDFGYLYAPNQSGVFLNRNRWYYNDRSMPLARNWQPDQAPDLLVIGNSIVAGGNPYDQPRKLTALLETRLGTSFALWPIAVGGWSTVNALGYLDRNPDIVDAADSFIWIHTSRGLSRLSPWPGDAISPRRRPIWATGFLLGRLLRNRLPFLDRRSPIEAKPSAGPDESTQNILRFETALRRLDMASQRRHAGILVLYPSVDEVDAARRGEEWLPERAALEAVAQRHGILVVDLTRYPDWTTDVYRDVIHPTAQGNEVLARIVVAALKRAQDE